MEPLGRKHHSGFHQLFVELYHLGKQFFAWHHACFRIFVCLNNNHKSHRSFLLLISISDSFSLLLLEEGLGKRGEAEAVEYQPSPPSLSQRKRESKYRSPET